MDSSELPAYGLGVRHAQIGLIFAMVLVMYSLNMAPPTAMVAMTEAGTSPNPMIPTFNWDDQSLVLSSFYWGFAPTQLLGGPLSRKYGFKWFMVGSMLIASMFSIFLPALVTRYGSVAMMFCLVIQGLCQGIVIPMLSDFVSIWSPLSERTPIGTFIFASKTLGTVLATEITGLLSSSWYGWPSAFYLYGLLGLIWSVVMVIFGYNSPEEHKTISQSELEYIKRGIIFTDKKKVPWSRILRSVPTWTTWITHIGLVWTIRLTTTEMPTYINRVLGFEVATASTFLSITYLLAYLNTFVASSVSQYLINRNYLSTGSCRIICNSIAAWGSALLLITLALFNLNRYINLVLIFFIFICTNISFSGFNINYNDLSPNYAGCIFGVGGLTSTAISFAPLLLAQIMVINLSSATQWGRAFVLAAVITGATAIPFALKGSGEVQDWDNIDDKEDEESRVLLDKSSCESKRKTSSD